MSVDHQPEQTAVRTHLGAIFVSLELSRATWLVTALLPGHGEKMSKHLVRGGVATPPTMVQTVVILRAAIARIEGRSDAEHDVDVPAINLNALDQNAD